MDKKQDLRVIKTKRSIKQAFFELVKKKPAEKITVTQVAEMAMINKGTFYLHYQDIYALYYEAIQDVIEESCAKIDFYPDFFHCPAVFAEKFLLHIQDNPLVAAFPFLDPASAKFPVPIVMSDELKRHIYGVGVLERTIQNDIKLEYVISSLFNVSFRYGKSHSAEVTRTIAQVIEALFPAKPE